MRCIFCKLGSSSSRSAEHIIPESLGNADHVLPPGVVCDRCNNYIAREIEKPLLNSVYFKERRFDLGIPNKKKRIPRLDGVHLQSGVHIQLNKSIEEPQISVSAAANVDEMRFLDSFLNEKLGTLIFPVSVRPHNYIMSRFVAKVGLEVLAHRVLDMPGALDEITDKPELDELRRYVRMGNPGEIWPYSFRSIYPPSFVFHDDIEAYEVLHEFDLLMTTESEIYIVIAIFGDEYALNLGGPNIEGYQRWLLMNSCRSPLYGGKNA